MKNNLTQIFSIFLIILLSIQLTISQEPLTQEELNKELEAMNQGLLTENLINNIDSLSSEQKTQVIQKIQSLESNSEQFWNNWHNLEANNKNIFWESFNQEQKTQFIDNLEKYYDTDL